MVISVASSIIASAVVVAWTISATLTEYRQRLQAHDSQLASMASSMQAIQARDGMQGEQLARSEAHWEDVVRRLDSIDSKLEPRRR